MAPQLTLSADLATLRRIIDSIDDKDIELDAEAEPTDDDSRPDLTEKEEVVLETIQNNPGYALRTIHKKASEQDGSPFNYSGEWDDEREEVQQIVYNLGGKGLIKNVERSWYPAGHPEVE